MALQLIVCSMVAMEQPKIGRLDITWQEMVEIGRELYQEHGENLDIHELILMDLNRSVSPVKERPISPAKEVVAKLVRRNTSEKISSGLKSACNILLGIRKISSSPAP